MQPNKLPLAAKIILPLLATLMIFLPLSGVFLVNRIQETRNQELLSLLQGQTDLIEESLELAEGVLKDFTDQDYIRALNQDPNSLVWITGKKNTQIYASLGPEDATRAAVIERANPKENLDFFPKIVRLPDEIWMVARTRPKAIILRKELAQINEVFSAISITQSTDELRAIKHTIFIVTGLTCLIACLAIVATVSLSTYNLRLFTRSISQINPNNPKWIFDRVPRSAEESRLFSTFKTMIEKIAQAKESQRLFIANASHELKTPVAGILAAMEVALSKDRSKEDYQETCRGVLQTARDLKRLTSTMLDLAAFEHNQYPGSEINLVEATRKLVDRWQKIADARKISLQLTEPTQKNLQIFAHPELFDVAIGNFIDNAIKYSYDQSLVIIEIQIASDNFFSIKIKDTGRGMNLATKQNLGDLFHMGDSSRTNVSSYGLGFAQAKRIIETFSGVVQVESELGVGTEITILIPAKTHKNT